MASPEDRAKLTEDIAEFARATADASEPAQLQFVQFWHEQWKLHRDGLPEEADFIVLEVGTAVPAQLDFVKAFEDA